MKISVLGTGDVGRQLATKLVAVGHEVNLGSRSADHEKAVAWAAEAGPRGHNGTFADSADFGEIVLNCTAGAVSLEALHAAGTERLAGKILIDVSNPLDFSKGFPPSLTVANTDSVGEQIQRAFPETKVVKTLNTVANHIMVDPTIVPGPHHLFVSGNDAEAKAQVTSFLHDNFGWKDVIDLGDITTSRGTEAWLLLWTRLYGALGNPNFNLAIVLAEASDG